MSCRRLPLSRNHNAVLFLLVTGWLLINPLLTTPRQALTGLALIALGLPVYAYWTRMNKET